MRFAPRSLFGRLMLVLLAGLLVAQLASFAIHMHERGEALSQASGMQAAQRIADIVRLLDSLAPTERRRVVQAFSAPPLAISLDQPPVASQPLDTESDARASLFGMMLRRFLGDGHPATVTLSEGPVVPAVAGKHPGFMGGPGAAMHGRLVQGPSFVAQVPLRDGTLVTFDARQPAQTSGWPYRLLASLAVLLVAVIAVSLVAVRWATRPLKDLADAADELGRNLDRPPMPEMGPLEVARAARAFNTMQSRLARYLRERTSTLAAMSHDLKTPVTRLRLRAELLDDGELKNKISQDLEEMESMVHATLEYMRGVDNAERVQRIDVAALLGSLQADFADMGGRVELSGAAAQPYSGRPQALKRCLGNLIDNAIKYGQRATILVEDGPDALVIRIRDAGPGIPQAELERVFEPFYRVEGSRSRDTGGTGLGLTIAGQIAQLHGGTLKLNNLKNDGLEAVLSLPRR
jgi:signal transduction histidine kinase